MFTRAKQAFLFGFSLVGTVALVVVPVWLSWHLVTPTGGPSDGSPRLRLYLETLSPIARGTAIRDEHIAYRLGRITAVEPIPHRSEAVGRYARVNLEAGVPLTRGDVSVMTGVTARDDNVLFAVAVKPFYTTYLSVGMRVAFARTTASSDAGDESDDKDSGETEGQDDLAAADDEPQDVIGLDSGFELVALSKSGEGNDANTVLEILLPRDEATIRDLAAGEWHPIVLPSVPVAAGRE